MENEQSAQAALLASNRAVKLDPMPQRRGRSKQDFGTPKALLKAVIKRFGIIGIDLAARADNTVADQFLSESSSPTGALGVDWPQLDIIYGAFAWLNPPFADLAPWAQKCATVRFAPRWTLMLCPASMGSKWWVEHVLGKAMVFGIPRVQFVGADSIYPKDLALLAYGFGAVGTSYWDWRAE